jgi:hypothetical protein
MEKIVKTRKDHNCGYCNKVIPKGSEAYYMEGKTPKYEIKGFEEKQIGIEYYKVYYCFGGEGDNMPACAEEESQDEDSNCTIHGVIVSGFKCESCGSDNIKERSGYKVCFDCGKSRYQ